MQNSYQNKTMQFGIVGLGLIGGSIAKALKARNFEVFAEDLNRNYLEAATKEGLISGSLNEIDQEKEFILIICVPVSAYADIFSHHKDLMTKAQLVTDCASVKNTLSDELNSHPSLQKNYVFSHPMAGSERSGFFHSDKDLFKDRVCILSKKDLTEKKSLDLCENLWRDLGSKIKFLDLKDHDKILASTSHLPHFIAFSLVKSLSNLDSDKIYSGGGLKDFTRIAASDVKMWKDIFSHNKEEILKAIDDFIESVNFFRTQIKQDDLDKIEKFIEEAKALKEHKL